MADASISVVIPSYNCGKWVAEAVDSALAQTLAPKQIIVVDDGSKDDTGQRLEPYRERGVEYVYQENRGVSAARNAGVARADGEFIAFLDADDVWHPEKLRWQVALMRSLPGLGLLGTGTFSWPGAVPTLHEAPGREAVKEIAWEHLVIKNYFTTSSILLRRTAINAVGPAPFDTALHGPEDYDLWLRIAKHMNVANLQVPLTGYRSLEGSLGKQARSMEAGMARILEKLGEAGAWNGTSGRLLELKARAYFRYSCGYMWSACGYDWRALCRLFLSMLEYPVFFRPYEVKMAFARPKLFVMTAMRWIGVIDSLSAVRNEAGAKPPIATSVEAVRIG